MDAGSYWFGYHLHVIQRILEGTNEYYQPPPKQPAGAMVGAGIGFHDAPGATPPMSTSYPPTAASYPTAAASYPPTQSDSYPPQQTYSPGYNSGGAARLVISHIISFMIESYPPLPPTLNVQEVFSLIARFALIPDSHRLPLRFPLVPLLPRSRPRVCPSRQSQALVTRE